MKDSRSNRLLAKSYDREMHRDSPPDYALLQQHSRDVAAACNALAETFGRIALFNACVNSEVFEQFRLALKTNGWIQDLGKANSHFQKMVTTDLQITQLVRHETISGMLVCLEPRLRQWLSPLSSSLFASVWGAVGHHRKFDERTVPEQVAALKVQIAHKDFADILADMSADLLLSAPPVIDRDLIIARTRKEPCDLGALESIRDLQEMFQDHEPHVAAESERRTLALIKAFGIAADVAASAIAERHQWSKDYSLTEYVHESFKVGLESNDLSKLISNWAWSQMPSGRSDRNDTSLPVGFIEREFQKQVANSSSYLTLAHAGCGSGKSLAAYMWARMWCEQFAQKGRKNFRLILCLPTTGTTTEHFKDYALESGIDASLMHSRSRIDLRAIAETAAQEEGNEASTDTAKWAQAALNAERDKIESLALWSTPLVVTTTDTVLGLMSNSRRSIYSLPAIMTSAIVFDEIHAFDDQMFGHLLVFLKHFPRLPVLLMTASLPEDRRCAIERIRPDLKSIAGPVEFELLERYLIKASVANEEVWHTVGECLRRGGKVLWVRNRVEWANGTYEECRKRFPNLAVNVYHSRFRYKDRSIRHRRAIDDFKKAGEATILVATQVAEMSLDLSADLLITDIAPISSLIQRMGRLNRRSTPDNKLSPKFALICSLSPSEPNNMFPYEKAGIDIATRWIQQLISLGKPLNQRDLSEAFEEFSEANEYNLGEAEKRAVFFSGLWRTRPGLTRDEGYTMSVILETDLQVCDERDKWGHPTRDWLRMHEVSIPIKEVAMRWKRIRTLRIAPSEMVEYDFNEETREGTGAKWRKS